MITGSLRWPRAIEADDVFLRPGGQAVLVTEIYDNGLVGLDQIDLRSQVAEGYREVPITDLQQYEYLGTLAEVAGAPTPEAVCV